MEFKGIKKLSEGHFITRYDISYETVDGKEKNYEIISRNHNIQDYEELHGPKADAVVLMMHSLDGQRLLINREFRMAAGMWVMNFPSGLIDPGETADQAAARELREETGLRLVSIDDRLGESYSAVGFSNEQNVCVIGKADGEILPSNSTVEEIEAKWYTKAEVRELLKTEKFAARTQAYCYLWSRE